MSQTTSEDLARVVAGRTVATAFRDQVHARGDAVALRWKVGDGWAELTWAEYGDRACRLAGCLACARCDSR